MIDDADVPILFALAVACLIWFASAVPKLLLAATGGMVIGAILWGTARCAGRIAAVTSRRLALDCRTVALLGAALLIGCRAPGR